MICSITKKERWSFELLLRNWDYSVWRHLYKINALEVHGLKFTNIMLWFQMLKYEISYKFWIGIKKKSLFCSIQLSHLYWGSNRNKKFIFMKNFLYHINLFEYHKFPFRIIRNKLNFFLLKWETTLDLLLFLLSLFEFS